MKTVFGVLISLVASACMGAETAAEEAAPAQQALGRAEGGTLESCRSFMQRQRACSAELIPALVDARVKADDPAGIAARDREIGRDALVREALAEWAVDSRDEAVEATCAEIARAIDPAREHELASGVSACLALPGRDEFVACAVPLNLMRWKH